VGQVLRELCPIGHSQRAEELLPWFALAVKALHEHAVAQCLESKHLESYLPVNRTSRRWSDRWKTIEQPLFPGYVFCRLDYNHRVEALRTPGVRSIVTFGAEVTPIADFEIERVRLMLAGGKPVEPWPFLRSGQQVRVHSGPFTGIEGILVAVRDSLRVVISLELLHRSVAVQIDRSCLTPITS
jgi:transcription antitermination factor NusG